MKTPIQSVVAGVLLAGIPLSHAADWPQWQGADRKNHSPDTGLMQEWPASGPERLWLFENAGLGYAGFAIVDDTLYTMGARDNGEFLLALNARTGEEVWNTRIGDLYQNAWGDGPRGTPTVDGDHVYTLGAQGELLCVKAEDGTKVWSVSLLNDLGGKLQNWGYTESVLIDGNKVICTPGGPKGTMAALNKSTGEVIWQSDDITDDGQYSSAQVVVHNGKRQYIQLVEKRLFGVDASNGDLLWDAVFRGRTAVIPTPIYDNGYVYATAGYGVGSLLVKLADDSRSAEEVYRNTVMKNHHGGVVKVGDHVYGYSDGPGWVCQNFLTGEAVWEHDDLGKGATHFADGRLYCLEEDSGKVVLAGASPDGWSSFGEFVLEPQSIKRSNRGKVWTHPVVLDGRLYLRDQEYIYCFDVKK